MCPLWKHKENFLSTWVFLESSYSFFNTYSYSALVEWDHWVLEENKKPYLSRDKDIQSSMSHKTQKTQKHAGICFPRWVNDATWGESPAGKLSRGFKLQVKVTAWKNKPKHEKPPLFSATRLKISWFCPDIIVTSDMNFFGFLASCEV